MLQRSLRSRSLHDRSISDYEVEQCSNDLLKGESTDIVPPRLANAEITTLTQMRKDCILQRRDGLANKIDEVLGELQRGPNKFQVDTPEDPVRMRSRALSRGPTPEMERLNKTGNTLVAGASLTSVDIPTRLAVTPILKTKRVLEVSRMHYPQSRSIDATIDTCIEYEVDSRRVGPRLLKINDLHKKLSDAQKEYSDARTKAFLRRQRFEEIHDAAATELENKLKDDMLVFGSHVPTSLPLEYSKFSNKVLDTRVREYRSAQIKLYDDAQALRGEAVKKERQELDTLSERFAKSFKLQRQTMMNYQEQQRQSFNSFWERKKQKEDAETNGELAKLKRACENLSRQLQEAEGLAEGEAQRIRNNDRTKALTPLAARPLGRGVATFK